MGSKRKDLNGYDAYSTFIYMSLTALPAIIFFLEEIQKAIVEGTLSIKIVYSAIVGALLILVRKYYKDYSNKK